MVYLLLCLHASFARCDMESWGTVQGSLCASVEGFFKVHLVINYITQQTFGKMAK